MNYDKDNQVMSYKRVIYQIICIHMMKRDKTSKVSDHNVYISEDNFFHVSLKARALYYVHYRPFFAGILGSFDILSNMGSKVGVQDQTSESPLP